MQRTEAQLVVRALHVPDQQPEVPRALDVDLCVDGAVRYARNE